MIVREEPDGGLLLVRQVDHSMLSGWLAAAWGAPPWDRPAQRESAIVGARLHDYAWIPWDEALVLRPDGRPYNFIEVDRAKLAPLYSRGADGVEAIDAYAGLLVSLHYSGFYHSHWGWQHWGRASLEGDEKAAVEGLVERELGRQRRLCDRLGLHGELEADLERNYKWLQLWDRVSLEICRQGFAGWEQELPAVPGPAGGQPIRLRMRLEPGGVCRLDPYPLLARPFRAAIPCVRVAPGGDVREAWRAGGGESLAVSFQPG